MNLRRGQRKGTLNLPTKQRLNRYATRRTINQFYRGLEDIIMRECYGKTVSRSQVAACLVRNGVGEKDARKYALYSPLLKKVGWNGTSTMYKIGRW
jgi:hypothetical protein